MTEALIEAPAMILKRRLVGLVVLLLGLFLLSLLMQQHDARLDGAGTVVIPLQPSVTAATNPAASADAPLLGEPEVTVAEPTVSTIAASPSVAKPVPPEPVRSKPSPAKIAPAVVDKPKPSLSNLAAPKPAAVRRWFVVVGSYKDPMAAQAIGNRIRMAGLQQQVTAVTVAGDRLHRVRAGPFTEKEAAESARATLIVEGLTKATVVGDK